MPIPKDGKLELLTDKNSALVLVDYQPTLFAGVASSVRYGYMIGMGKF